MAQILLDTHVFLWFVFDDPRLSAKAARLIADSKTTKVLSLVSLWEIAVKVSIGRLVLGMPYRRFVSHYAEGRAIELLDIDLSHLTTYSELPLHHRDPFDRLLVAQCQSESLPIVTADSSFAAYGLKVLW